MLVKLMDSAISANPEMSAKQRNHALQSSRDPLNSAMFPAKSTMYRAQRQIKEKELKYYNTYWSRLEVYVKDLQTLNNDRTDGRPRWLTKVYRDTDQRHFKRFFVGIGPALRICKHAGLDQYALDATFTKHDVVNGMQYHILCGRSGANRRIPLAISLEQTESNATYECFGRMCRKFGVQDVLQLEPGNFDRRCCVISDGAKGTNKFTQSFKVDPPSSKRAPFRTRCAKHLANSCRAHLITLKRKNSAVNCAFADAQVYRIAEAASEKAFNAAMKSLNRKFPDAAKYLMQSDPSQWNYYHMAHKHRVGGFGHKTSNTVEGFNGTIVEWRKQHPYIFLHSLVTYVNTTFRNHKIEARKWEEEGRLITPYASNMFEKEKRLFLDRAFNIQQSGDVETFHVCDLNSKHKVRHTVCISEARPSCKPCDTWCQHKIPCRHMIAALHKYKKNMLVEDRDSFLRCYFHPAYHVESLNKAYENIEMEIPHAKTGSDDEIVVISSDNGGGGGGGGDDDDDDDEVQDENPKHLPMLPPNKYTLETYKLNKRPGRKRTKRFRSRGGTASDGGANPPQGPNWEDKKQFIDTLLF